jgi:hypothetical protein
MENDLIKVNMKIALLQLILSRVIKYFLPSATYAGLNIGPKYGFTTKGRNSKA